MNTKLTLDDIKIKESDCWKMKLVKLFITLAVATVAWWIKVKS